MKFLNIPSILFILLLHTNAGAWQFQQGPFDQWWNAQPVSPNVQRGLELFFKTSNGYTQKFPAFMKAKIFDEFKTALVGPLAADKCQNSSNASFPKDLSFNLPATAASFEKHVLRIESIDCLGNLDLERTVNLFLSPSFQTTSLKLDHHDADEKTNRVCQKVLHAGWALSFCFNYEIWQSENMIVIHYINDSNETDADQNIYMRDFLSVFIKNKDGELVFYNLGYSRGPGIPAQGLIKKIAGSQQKRMAELLIQKSQP